MEKAKTIIVGAGMTGLTAGYLLSKNGRECVLVEKENDVGGLCRTYRLDDIIFDLGPHLFFNNPAFEAERFMMELLSGEAIIKRRFRFAIFNRGSYWKFPLSVFDLLFYPLDYIKHFLLSLKSKSISSAAGTSLEQDIIAKGGRSYYEEVFAPMLLKKTLIRGKMIHRDWVARVDRDVRNRREPSPEISRGSLLGKILSSVYQTYYYPVEGFQRFPQKLLAMYRQNGGETILNCGTVGLERSDDRITGVVVNGRSIPASHVIWTASANSLNELLGKNVKKMRYVKTIIVLLTYNMKRPVRRPFVYVYCPDKDLIFNRVYYPSSIYRNRLPSGKEGICLELNYNADLDKISDKEIVRRSVKDVETGGLFKSAELRTSRVVRLGESLPVYDLDYTDQMEGMFKGVHSYNNLYSVGRLGGYFFCMTPPAVSQGLKIARHILQND